MPSAYLIDPEIINLMDEIDVNPLHVPMDVVEEENVVIRVRRGTMPKTKTRAVNKKVLLE
jgi:hypothetical protein